MKYALALLALLTAIPAYAETLPMLAYLEGEVNDTSVQAVIDVIVRADDIGNRVILEIDTDGGEVDSGFRLVKAIERAKKPVTCIVDGRALSMGSYIFEACARRVMTKRSMLMIHEAGTQAGGHEADLLETAAEVGTLTRSMFEHYAHRISGLSVSEMIAKTANGHCIWLGWKQAKQIGAVDLVVDSVTDVK